MRDQRMPANTARPQSPWHLGSGSREPRRRGPLTNNHASNKRWRVRMMKVTWVVAAMIVMGCERHSPPPSRDFSKIPISPFAVAPGETRKDCEFRWLSPPMEMLATEPAGQSNMGVILGFWFGSGQVPVLAMRRAVSNVLSTPGDEYSLTVITMEFVNEETAESARATLAARMPRSRIERTGVYLVAAGAGPGSDPGCIASVVDLQMKKLALVGKP